MKSTILKSFMQQVLFYTLVCSIISFSACKKTDKSTTDLSGTYNITNNQTISLPKDGNKVTLTLSGVIDMRCPPNANCVTNGPATATLIFKDGIRNEEFQLCLNCNTSIKVITYRGIKYSFSLKEVKATPLMSSVAGNPPSIILLVERI